MSAKNDFLFELLTEELPPKNLQKLSLALENTIIYALKSAQINFKSAHSFATPRRLAILIEQLDAKQPSQKIERRGPAWSSAFDDTGNPTKACLGFARSCETDVKNLKKIKTDKGEFVVFNKTEPGKTIFELMPNIIVQALKSLPITRPMRWGNHDAEFVRPIHSAIMLLGNKIIPAEIFNIKTGNKTIGHRFLSPTAIVIKNPNEYEKILKENYVIADFDKRKDCIYKQLIKLAQKINAKAIIENELLSEVTALVEYPVALLANFPKYFLKLPQEVLISSMQNHQKCFPIKNSKEELLPNFITISNIKSKNPQVVICGNERVMNARLSDAKFFFETDLKQSLESRVSKLKNVIFQKQLGSLFDKTKRVEILAGWIAKLINGDEKPAKRAGFLSKADLITEMVGEFPELQGIMGNYYAQNDNESPAVATAIKEQYMPTNANAALPKTKTGIALAIADRIDTLIGTFGINKIPTGESDPFGLRRAALGVLRIIIENQLDLNLLFLLERAKDLYQEKLINKDVVINVLEFMLERLKFWLQEQDFSANEFAAVFAKKVYEPYDFYRRIQAVKSFVKLKESESLATANKRVNNLLAKETISFAEKIIDENLLKETAEIKLSKLITEKRKNTGKLYNAKKYVELLKDLAELRNPIDLFFDKVMVMVEDENLRLNRLTLLAKLRELFLQVADISLLQY